MGTDARWVRIGAGKRQHWLPANWWFTFCGLGGCMQDADGSEEECKECRRLLGDLPFPQSLLDTVDVR